VTLAFYPGVPREEVGFRIQVTAANTDEEITVLLTVLDQLADVIPLASAGVIPLRRTGMAAADDVPDFYGVACS
jgi:hypothetical protein